MSVLISVEFFLQWTGDSSRVNSVFSSNPATLTRIKRVWKREVELIYINVLYVTHYFIPVSLKSGEC